MNFKRVVITGLGTINPLGHNVAEFWENLKGGVSGAGPITRFDASKFRTQFACEVKNYEPTEYFDKKEVRKMDLYSQFALICSREAVKDAGLDFSQEDRKRIGVIWGAGIGGLDTFYEECKTFALGDGTPRFNPFFIPKMIANMGGAMIAIEEGLKGPNYTTVSACASSAHSLVDALNLIRLGKADVILAGGSEAAITPPGVGGFNSMKALSTRNDDPKTASRPFDADRDGFVIGREEFFHSDLVLIELKRLDIDLIVLAGFLWKVPDAIIDAYQNRVINIHPALLPSYGGKGMYGMKVHEAVIAAGEKESGITIHHVNNHYDEGATIFQAKCEIDPGDTPETLATKVHAMEYDHFPRVIKEFLDNL